MSNPSAETPSANPIPSQPLRDTELSNASIAGDKSDTPVISPHTVPDASDLVLWRTHLLSVVNVVMLVPIYYTDAFYRSSLVPCLELVLLAWVLAFYDEFRELTPAEKQSLRGNLVVFAWLAYGTLPWFPSQPGLVLRALFTVVQCGIHAFTVMKSEYRFGPLVNVVVSLLFPMHIAKWQTDLQVWILCTLFVVHWQFEIQISVMRSSIHEHPFVEKWTRLFPLLRFGFAFALLYSVCLFAFQILAVQGALQERRDDKHGTGFAVDNLEQGIDSNSDSGVDTRVVTPEPLSSVPRLGPGLLRGRSQLLPVAPPPTHVPAHQSSGLLRSLNKTRHVTVSFRPDTSSASMPSTPTSLSESPISAQTLSGHLFKLGGQGLRALYSPQA